MKRLVILLTLALVASSCANHLGLGEAECMQRSGNVSTANILNVQAVPTAKYTPCLDGLPLGWDSVKSFAENGRAGFNIVKSFDTFLTATVTESCDVSGAVSVESGFPDIKRFEDVDVQATVISIAIIPSGDEPLFAALALVDDLAGAQIDDRPVAYVVDRAIDESVSSRVELALTSSEYVWIIDELDAEEGTVQLRSDDSTANGRGLVPEEALGLIEEVVPGVSYDGNWYFTFDGGCITYEFDADGILAESVAADAEETLGFFNALELRDFARDLGFDIG